MAQTITYDTILDCNQVIRYNYPGTDANGNNGYYFAAIVTNMKTQGSDGTVRDTQTINPVGGFQTTEFTPQQIYTTVNGSTPGPLLATDLKSAYLEGINTTVS